MLNRKCQLIIGFMTLLFSPFLMACPECWWDSPSSSNKWEQMPGNSYNMPSMRRHHYVMREGLPKEYRSLKNPLDVTESVLEQGKQVYKTSCAVCHGDTGRGDGIAAKSVNPKPANLKHMSRMMMMATDSYMYWTISEGGKPIETDMPAFTESLTEDEIWSVIHYIEQEIPAR